MEDFFQICTKEARGGVTQVYPDFTVGRSQDLMIRGQSFYAIWDEKLGLWSTDEYDVRRIVDEAVLAHCERLKADGVSCTPMLTRSYETGRWDKFRRFLRNVADNSHQLDMKVTFADTPVKKSDYVSRRLPYSLSPGPHPAWDEITSTLYDPEELDKIVWSIGAIIAGDSKKIEKFLVLFGPPGSGKGTIIEIMMKLFDGYYTTFDAKALVSANNAFSTESFKGNPLLAINSDGDLSKIADNSKLNAVVSHDAMTFNEKYKPSYTTRSNAYLVMGTNEPVRITNANSGITRRLIDAVPSGRKIEVNTYYTLRSQIDFELGAIAHHCLQRYLELGKNHYNAYRPMNMMFQTDVFLNFVDMYYDVFKGQDGTTLKQAYSMYKEYCAEANIEFKLPMHKFREELKRYFEEFLDRHMIDGVIHRSYYRGFTANPFKTSTGKDAKTFSLVLDETTSLLDELYAKQPAQTANEEGTPRLRWSHVTTTLSELDTGELHYVSVPQNHIVIDFDLRGDDGKKSLERNLSAASEWPATYAELSQSGGGVHLHYVYDGPDVNDLGNQYTDGIEIKVFNGGSSLRRRLSRCNAVSVASISSGLPFKEKKTMQDTKVMHDEKSLRALIAKNLRKEVHPGTKPSIDFIAHILDEAYQAGIVYDVTDMRSSIMAFANNSTNQALACLKITQKMKFKSDTTCDVDTDVAPADERLVIFDVEVYPNLFVVCWSYEDSDTVVRMINPDAREIEALLRFKLVGFNNRQYDNHILWARFMGYNNQQLYELSKKIIANERGVLFGEAYNVSFTDIYEFSSVKMSLKKFMILLGLHHMEMDLPWDEPVPEELWPKVVEYCVNDVVGTKAVLKDRAQDFVARKILASLSGLSVNETTQRHTARIVFGTDRRPQENFVYTDLSLEFPGYVYDAGVSTYRGELVGEGGWVDAKPGMYEDVTVLDIASMHPTTIDVLNLFGEYTPNFAELTAARLAIKHKNYEQAGKMLGGKLAPYLGSTEDADALAYALKIIINIVYGLTSAKFDNPFRDIRNIDNIVAKRGSLFMVDLREAVQERGFNVIHIKTDSIKIPGATPEIIEFVKEFGQRYGYTFEHEATYEKMCLVNDSVYIAKVGWNAKGKDPYWYAVGAEFQHPVVFKALFSMDPITFEDLCETKQVRSPAAMYLDFDESLATPAMPYRGMHFVGRTGMFLPVLKVAGGAKLVQVRGDKTYAVSGTKGYWWLEAEMVKALNLNAVDRLLFENLTDGIGVEGSITDIVDIDYYTNKVHDALETIEKFGSYTDLIK